MKDYAADTDAYGVTLFFLGVCYTILEKWQHAESVLGECLRTSWGRASPHNSALIYFTRGKQFQRQCRHEEAIKEFTAAIEEEPDNAYAIFRRGWSYKVSF